MRLGVIGTGHVGLVTCVCFSSFGHDVVGTDSDVEKIRGLAQGRPPFFEPGLEEMLATELASGRLSFSAEPADAIREAEAVFVCVGTPARSSGEASLAATEHAARQFARYAPPHSVFVEKSTVPAGSALRIRRTIVRERPDLEGELEIASNPEFLREGNAISDSLHPDRILVGAEAAWVFDLMRRVYKPLLDKGHRLIETDLISAELAKHMCNTYLALRVSLLNAFAEISERAGGDIAAVTEVMGSDPRIGPHFLRPGIGYGGSCFPKDLRAFDRLAKSLGYDFPILQEIARLNDEAAASAVRKVKDAVWNLEGKRIALLGLAFKPDTDDTRFSPALEVARRLVAEGADVVAYDPRATLDGAGDAPPMKRVSSVYEALQGSSCAVICTEWDEFRNLDLDRVKLAMAEPLIVDGRNVLEPSEMRAAGFVYYPTGRPPVLG